MRPSRVAGAAAVALAVLAGCADPATIERQRLDALADTCVSIVERSLGDGFDRDRLRDQAGPQAFAELYERFDGRRPAAVTLLRAACRPQP